MGFKRNLWIGIASAVLGLGLIGGGTVAYFSDSTSAEGKLIAGELELTGGDTFYKNEMVPGETYEHSFTLKNKEKVDIEDLETDIETGANVDILKDDLKLKSIEVGGQKVKTNVSMGKLHGQNHDLSDLGGLFDTDAMLDKINSDGLDVKMVFEFKKKDEDQSDAMGETANIDVEVIGYSER